MSLTGLLPLLREEPAVASALEHVRTRGDLDVVAPAGARPALLALLAEPRPLVVVTATGREADELAAALRSYRSADDVAVLPAWETLPHERLSPRADTVARRLAVMRRLAHPEDGGPVRVLVVPVRALLQPVVAGLGELEPVSLAVGDTVSLEEVVERLVGAAYQRTDLVGRRGEFAVRGGILDVFAPTDEHPVRVELWGDEVTEVRWFSVADQRTIGPAEALWAPPCREILLTDEVRLRAAELAEQLPGAADMLSRLAEGIAVEGMESLAPVLVERMQPVLELVDPDSLLLVLDPERVRARAHDLVATTEEFLAAAWHSAAAGAQVPIDLRAASFASLAETRDLAHRLGLGWWTVGPFTSGPEDALAPAEEDEGERETLRLDARDVVPYRGEVARAVQDMRALQREGWRIVLTTEGPGPARRMVEQLGEVEVPARLLDRLEGEPAPGSVVVVPSQVGVGFVAEGLRLAVVTETDLTGRSVAGTRQRSALPTRRRRNEVDPLSLRPGDFVVHEKHGVGRFVELTQRTVKGAGGAAAVREYLVIEYASSKRGQPGDRLFVPTDQLDQISRYVGGETPTLNKLGGADWAKAKGRARKAVREIAGELIRLYSARMASKGHAFSPDTPWQRELEDAFPYAETPDQLATIEDVKRDMERPVPMDRLVCGDVGYGKTEIAVRAAFKAVQDGKQVAVLVPTTLLVNQHLETFTERYAPFPVTVRALSRFQSDAEARAVLEGLADGSVDVVIGTHRLLTGQVRFKDLGLVIIDEEQRFGVEHKEFLKALRTSVDVLAMSATPIPRTLEMAVTGIREMSTLSTPPEERHPVLTYVGPQDDKQVAAAIRRELLREGQVFYVHNRVSSIDKTAKHLAELVPEARIAVAHGKMSENQLERVMLDFWERRVDVLVSTTIIETGLDVSNANTLILERADTLGLSQLHQLRGRVGRGRERAYAYFLYPPDKPLTETAHDRLATIAANNELGAGMAVALKDLEIRGAGNLLGGEQSGHIEGVGFDLYLRMVGEAVAEFRGEEVPEPVEVTIELPLDAHLPHEYIEHDRLRLEAYRKIAAAETAEALAEVREELVDRYGPVPPAVEGLFEVAALRNRAREAGLTDITQQGRYVRLAPVELPESAQLRVRRIYPGSVVKPAIRTVLVPVPSGKTLGSPPIVGAELLAWVRQVIDVVAPRPEAAAS